MSRGRPVVSTYERLRVIGRGGMGEVFLARQRGVHGFERPVALKRILPGYAHDPEFRRMFAAEARAMAALGHPNICQTIELFSVDDDLFLVLELLEGVSLAALLAHVGPLPPDVVCGLCVQACAGLEHAHARGVVHRDLSPSNLFVTSSGLLKILDFGVAKSLDEGAGASTGGAKGKRPYLSPEQVNGQPVDGRSDLFALGAVGLETLTGRPVFERGSDYLTYRAILEDTRQIDLTRTALEPIFGRCIDVEPAHRPASARALAHELRAALPGGGASPLELSEFIEKHMAEKLHELRALVAEALAAPPAEARVLEHTVVTARPDEPEDVTVTSVRSVAEAFDPTPTPMPDAHAYAYAPAPARAADQGAFGPSSSRAGRASPPTPPGALAPALEPTPPAFFLDDRAPGRGRRRLAWIVAGCAALGIAGGLWMAAGGSPEHATVADASAPPMVTATPRVPPDAPPRAAGPPDATPAAAEPDPAPDFEIATLPDPAPTQPQRVRAPGFASIDAVPFATITIDGKVRGPTPLLKLSLPAGTHRVKAVTEDGRSKRFTITVRPGALTVERVIFR